MSINSIIMASAGNAGVQFIGATSSGASSATITLPTKLMLGDIVIIASCSDAAAFPNTPTGYTLGQRDNNGNPSYMWSYKIITGTVDTTASGLTNNATTGHIALAFRNVSQSNPLDVAAPSVNLTTTGMPDCPSITTVNQGCVVLIGYIDDDIVTDTTAPTGWTLAINKTVGSSGSGNTLMAAYKFTNSGTFNPAAFGGTGNDTTVGASIGLRFGY